MGHTTLFDQLTDFGNLLAAYKRAARVHRNRVSVQAYEYDLEGRLLSLRDRLRTKIYTFGAYHTFMIHDPKTRRIAAAPFEDRVVHHAIHAVIEPLFEPDFIEDSYACRKNKGAHRALLRCFSLAQTYRFVLKCDIATYFDSVNGHILFSLLAAKVTDERLRTLLLRLIAGGTRTVPGSQQYLFTDDIILKTDDRGIPIGNLTSQLFANIYLNELDHFVITEFPDHPYLRYMDDFLVFGAGKRRLWHIEATLRRFLTRRLRLALHPRKVSVSPVRAGLDALGFVTRPDGIRLRHRNLVRFLQRKTLQDRRLRQGVWGSDLGSILSSRASFAGMANYLYPKPLRDYWVANAFAHPLAILPSSITSAERISYPFVDRKESS